MRNFIDDSGKEWPIAVNVYTVKMVHEATDIWLTSICDSGFDLLGRLYSDPVLLADIGWAIIESNVKYWIDKSHQTTGSGTDVREFAESISGDSVGRLRTAIVEETIDFFDDPETRDAIRASLRKVEEIAEEIRSEAKNKIEKLDPKRAAKTAIASRLSSPVFAESIPGGIHSEN